MKLIIHSHVLFLLALACVVVECYGLEFYRRNPGAINARSRAIIMEAMLDLIRSINRNARYYTGITFVDLTLRTDEGSLVSVAIRSHDLVEPWYSQLGICSIFPSWGVMQPGLTLQYNFMRLYRILYTDPGNYGETEVTQGRYTLSYKIGDPENGPDMFDMAAACSNCSESKKITSSNIESTVLADESSFHVNYTAVNWEAAELSSETLHNDYNEADCWVYKCCILSGPHDSPLSMLGTGQVLKSPTGRYYLIMQADCNLVLYTEDGIPVWASGTQNKGTGCFLRMQMDGNLVIYDSAYNVMWSYLKYCRKPCWLPFALCVEDSGQVAVCNTAEQTCIWSSKS